jgi:hypothetical protein
MALMKNDFCLEKSPPSDRHSNRKYAVLLRLVSQLTCRETGGSHFRFNFQFFATTLTHGEIVLLKYEGTESAGEKGP